MTGESRSPMIGPLEVVAMLCPAFAAWLAADSRVGIHAMAQKAGQEPI